MAEKKTTSKRRKLTTKRGGKTLPASVHRYGHVKSRNIKAMIERHHEDDDPLNLSYELAAMRALFEDWVNRYDKFQVALHDWHDSWRMSHEMDDEAIQAVGEMLKAYSIDRLRKDASAAKNIGVVSDWLEEHQKMRKRKPRQIVDIGTGVNILDKIAHTAYRIEDLRLKASVPLHLMKAVMAQMGKVVFECVTDPDLQRHIKAGWDKIRIPM